MSDDAGDPAAARVFTTLMARWSCCWSSAGALTLVAAPDRVPRAGAGDRARSRVPTVAVIHPTTEGAAGRSGAAGDASGVRRVADLRAHERLSEEVDARHRQPREAGRAARRHRRAGARPGTLAGEGALAQQIAANADAREVHRRSAGRALRKTDAVSQQEVDEKQERVTPAAGQPGRRRRERPAARGTRGVQAHLRAVRRRHHEAQRGRRHARHGGHSGAQQQLFHLAQTDPDPRVRHRAGGQRAGDSARAWRRRLEMAQYPGEQFAGAVARTAESIDPATRTLLTEVDVPNPTGRLLPGGYAQVHLQVGATGAPAAGAGQRAALPRRGPARGRRGRRTTACTCGRSRSDATTARRSKFCRASRPTTGSCSIPRTRSTMGRTCRSSRPAAPAPATGKCSTRPVDGRRAPCGRARGRGSAARAARPPPAAAPSAPTISRPAAPDAPARGTRPRPGGRASRTTRCRRAQWWTLFRDERPERARGARGGRQSDAAAGGRASTSRRAR